MTSSMAHASDFREHMARFLSEEIEPREEVYERWLGERDPEARSEWPGLEDLRAAGRERGLWNLYLRSGAGLSHSDYAPIAELSGRSPDIAPAAINGGAPNSVNMVMLEEAATADQKERWLPTLLAGTGGSAFAMTEPDVASSDATNMATRFTHEGDKIRISGHKWYVSGAADPRCQIIFVLGVSDPDADRHARHSIVAVPADAPGVRVSRTLPLYGFHSDPAEIFFEDVVVPADHLIGSLGGGFKVAQTRLAAARLHHSMRLVGMSERALRFAVARARSRFAFGDALADKGQVRAQIAECRLQIDQARLVTLNAARLVDDAGGRAAQAEISQAKVATTRAAVAVIDRAIAIHGARGLSNETPLARWFAQARGLHIADGPEEVHLEVIARAEFRPAS